MKIAIDAMGGDNAPEAIVKGTIMAAEKLSDITLYLVGNKDLINENIQLSKFPNIKIKHADEKIEMNESPAHALRKKKNSSIVIGSKLVKDNKADAFISAGNTGAVMASGIFNIGRIKGISRPAIATVFPSAKGQTMVLDSGANVDSKAENLLYYAITGQIHYQNIFKKNNPGIGILSVGEEKEKGNKLSKNTFKLLENDKRIKKFIGNIEGRDIFNGNCDIVICDGFTGNIVLKTTEGVANYIFSLLKEMFTSNLITRLSALVMKPYLSKMKEKLDYRQYGGAPLLGINGVVIISHGSSDATAIYNAIKVARKSIINNVIYKIKEEINKE